MRAQTTLKHLKASRQKRRVEGSALYGVLARYYDRIYHWKDYPGEAAKVSRLVRNFKVNSGNHLLDVGCGTGMHIKYLRKDFHCVGVDSSPEMLAVASKNVPGVEFIEGEMTDFSLGRRFDVVICLFSGIGYLRTRNQTRRAMANFSRHLNGGGVMIIELWVRKPEWRNERVDFQKYDTDEVKIARMDYGLARGNFSILDERYLIAEKNKGISYLKTKHIMRFFEPEEVLGAMRSSGLISRYLRESLMPGRGLLVGVKPANGD